MIIVTHVLIAFTMMGSCSVISSMYTAAYFLTVIRATSILLMNVANALTTSSTRAEM